MLELWFSLSKKEKKKKKKRIVVSFCGSWWIRYFYRMFDETSWMNVSLVSYLLVAWPKKKKKLCTIVEAHVI